MSNFKFYTYAHYKADTKEIFYIGKGCGNRSHVKAKRSNHWKSIVAKHGLIVEILARFENEYEALDHERFLISTFRDMGFRLCNLMDGGDGVPSSSWTDEMRAKISAARKGRKASDETRKRMSESATGRPMSKDAIEKTASFHRGRKRSQETLDRMSASLKGLNTGRVVSQETREKISIIHKGSKRSDEAKARMSKAALGKKKRPQSEEHRRKISEKRKAYWDRVRLEKALAISNKHDLESS